MSQFYAGSGEELLAEFERHAQENLNDKVKAVSLKLVEALSKAVDAKDRYTNGHSKRVAEYSVKLARKLGMGEEALDLIRCEGLLHDVGKIGVPDSVLNKAGRLTDNEFNIIKAHTTLGSEILKDVDIDETEIKAAARSHHERFDGKGYPDGLKGKEIPMAARIIAIADTFDAMNSDRIYRKRLPKDIIRDELVKGRGTQFDPDYLDVFLELFDNDELEEKEDAISEEKIIDSKILEFKQSIEDFLELFRVKKEYVGEWDYDIKDIESFTRYIRNISGGSDIEFTTSIISISAKENEIVSDEKQDKAISTIRKVIKELSDDMCVSMKISRTQVVVVLINYNEEETNKFMQESFIYFYRIFEAEAFEITNTMI